MSNLQFIVIKITPTIKDRILNLNNNLDNLTILIKTNKECEDKIALLMSLMLKIKTKISYKELTIIKAICKIKICYKETTLTSTKMQHKIIINKAISLYK